MFSRRIQDATQVHDLLAIQLQGVNRRSPDRRQADHEFKRLVPGEMVAPYIAARVE